MGAAWVERPVFEGGRLVGHRGERADVVSHYGCAAVTLRMAETRDAVQAAFNLLYESVRKKGFDLNDPRVALELHFIRKD